MPPNTPKFIHHFIKNFSTSTTPVPTSSTWRTQAKQHQLVTQISTILLQRHNWSSLLKTLNIPHNLSAPIFLQILDKTQTNPEISLDFFNWAKSNLGFQPDLKTHCKLTQIISGSNDTRPIKPILDSFIGFDPPTHVVHSMVHACKGTNLHALAFSFIIECYAQKGLYFDSLVVYREIVSLGYLPKVSCLNKVLDVLDHAGEFKLSYCLYGSMFRNGILFDTETWTFIARMLCRSGKVEKVARLLDSGVCNFEIFELVVSFYSRIGNFESAFDQVSEMSRRNFKPGFNIYGSILDGACKFGDASVIDMVLCAMKEKKLMLDFVSSGYDVAIRKLCDLGKTYAAEFLLKRACDEKFRLTDATVGCMLSAFCKEGRVDEAMWLYRVILSEKIAVKKSCFQDLVDSLCVKEPMEDSYELLIGLIKRGFSPCVSDISKFMMKLARKDKWFQVEELLDVMLRAELLPDCGCCRSMVKHYCSSGQIDSALWLHDKLQTLWDVTTYNILLRAIFMEKRIEEALSIFDCMRRKNVVNTASFVVMISGLSQEKEMRKAMQVHDEMLKLGLKPGLRTYKSLVSVFK